MDAGSSHTGFFAYKWVGEKTPHATQGTGIVSQVDHCKIQGGIASEKAHDKEHVALYLKDCFTKIMTKISSLTIESSQDTVPVYFAATAGMRLLNLTSHENALQILYSVNEFVSNFKLEANPDKGIKEMRSIPKLTAIISGVNEGFYSWVGANYLTGTLLPHKERSRLSWLKEHKNHKSNADSTIDTSAILDLGGASTQIAFEIVDYQSQPKKNESSKHSIDGEVPSFKINDIKTDEVMVHDPSIITVQLYGKNHSIKSQSNLCFGMSQAKLRHHFKLLQETTDQSVEIVDPCMPSYMRYSVSGQEFIDTPCLKASEGNQWKDVDAEKHYKFIGSSDDAKCQQTVNDMLDWNTCGKQFERCFKFDPSQSQVTSSKKIIAISGFSYSAKILYLNEDSSISQDEFKSQTSKLCSSDLYDVLRFSAKIDKDYVGQYCFQLKYVDRLLTAIYKIHGDKFSDIVFTTKINQQSFGWALGLMINATNILPSATIEGGIISGSSFISIAIFAVLIVCISMVVYAASKRKRDRNISRELSLEKPSLPGTIPESRMKPLSLTSASRSSLSSSSEDALNKSREDVV